MTLPDNRVIVSWVISDEMTAESTTVTALKQAVAKRKPQDDLIFHSERGSQHSCGNFREKFSSVGQPKACLAGATVGTMP